MIKKKFTDEEMLGLTNDQIKMAKKYMRSNRTYSKVPDLDAVPLYELFLMGFSPEEIHKQYPNYELAQIILTVALGKWFKKREEYSKTVKDRVHAKVVKTLLDTVDYFTLLLAVNNTENIEAMRKYIKDPANSPLPKNRIENIKEYREVVDALMKIFAKNTDPKKPSRGLDDMLEDKTDTSQQKKINSNVSLADIVDDDAPIDNTVDSVTEDVVEDEE